MTAPSNTMLTPQQVKIGLDTQLKIQRAKEARDYYTYWSKAKPDWHEDDRYHYLDIAERLEKEADAAILAEVKAQLR